MKSRWPEAGTGLGAAASGTAGAFTFTEPRRPRSQLRCSQRVKRHHVFVDRSTAAVWNPPSETAGMMDSYTPDAGSYPRACSRSALVIGERSFSQGQTSVPRARSR